MTADRESAMWHCTTAFHTGPPIGDAGVDGYYRGSCMEGLLSLNETVALLVLAIGAAMVIGNLVALVRGGRHESEHLYVGRAWFLMLTGVVITAWSIASLAQ